MKIKILGSGGCVPLPRPTCKCKVCKEAREKGKPYSRKGCSIFIEDINTIVDTPEDIVWALNAEGVEKVENILYSHWDPDHTLGLRVIEALKLDWFQYYEGKEIEDKIDVIGLKKVIEDLKCIKNKFGSYLDYYESMGLIKVESKNELEEFYIKDTKVTIVSVGEEEIASIFVFENKGKKFIYAPCDVKPFPWKCELFYDADVMVIGNTIPDEPLKNGIELADNHPMKDILFVMDEIIEIKETYRIKEVIITHIEEDWGKSYDDYKKLEEKYENIKFAYDGMVIEI